MEEKRLAEGQGQQRILELQRMSDRLQNELKCAKDTFALKEAGLIKDLKQERDKRMLAEDLHQQKIYMYENNLKKNMKL